MFEKKKQVSFLFFPLLLKSILPIWASSLKNPPLSVFDYYASTCLATSSIEKVERLAA